MYNTSFSLASRSAGAFVLKRRASVSASLTDAELNLV